MIDWQLKQRESSCVWAFPKDFPTSHLFFLFIFVCLFVLVVADSFVKAVMKMSCIWLVSFCHSLIFFFLNIPECIQIHLNRYSIFFNLKLPVHWLLSAFSNLAANRCIIGSSFLTLLRWYCKKKMFFVNQTLISKRAAIQRRCRDSPTDSNFLFLVRAHEEMAR